MSVFVLFILYQYFPNERGRGLLDQHVRSVRSMCFWFRLRHIDSVAVVFVVVYCCFCVCVCFVVVVLGVCFGCVLLLVSFFVFFWGGSRYPKPDHQAGQARR